MDTMKIVLLGHDDIASLYALSCLVSELPEHDFEAFLSSEPASSPGTPDELRELAKVDRRLCRSWQPHLPKVLAGAGALPAPNSAAGIARLREAAPDLLVSIRYRRILRDAAIATARLGVLNLHSGVLPDYRGVMATFWAMLAGEPEIGTTLHWITDSGIDTGPVIDIARRPAEPGRSYLANVLALYPDGVNLLAQAIRATASGSPPAGHRQPNAGGRYFSTPDAEALQSWRKRGLVLWDGTEGERLI
jgi:methionyl-tRNA formyltransferase